MKPILTWLQSLPEPYRSQAVKNCVRPNQVVATLQQAIYWAFDWGYSAEGIDYWADLNKRVMTPLFRVETILKQKMEKYGAQLSVSSGDEELKAMGRAEAATEIFESIHNELINQQICNHV